MGYLQTFSDFSFAWMLLCFFCLLALQKLLELVQGFSLAEHTGPTVHSSFFLILYGNKVGTELKCSIVYWVFQHMVPSDFFRLLQMIGIDLTAFEA